MGSGKINQVRHLLESRPRVGQLVLFLFGALTTLAFAPFGLYFLMPVLMLSLMFVWLHRRTNDPRQYDGTGI